MNRRAFVGAIGALGSLGVLGYTSRPPVETIEVRFWLSERAGTYDRVADRVAASLRMALDFEFWSVDVSFGGTLSVSREDGAAVTVGGEWPAAVVAGLAGRGHVDPVGDVNLLVTDGQMREAPTGYGIPHVASVGGARFLAELDPVAELDEIVPYRTPERVAQILVHEAGHALGLDHSHGAAFRRGDAVVATPMLSAYAWDRTYAGADTVCGVTPETDGLERRLTFAFSPCARRSLERYRGGFTRW